MSGALAGRLEPTRREDGVVSVYTLTLQTPATLHLGQSVAFVLTPSNKSTVRALYLYAPFFGAMGKKSTFCT